MFGLNRVVVSSRVQGIVCLWHEGEGGVVMCCHNLLTMLVNMIRCATGTEFMLTFEVSNGLRGCSVWSRGWPLGQREIWLALWCRPLSFLCPRCNCASILSRCFSSILDVSWLPLIKTILLLHYCYFYSHLFLIWCAISTEDGRRGYFELENVMMSNNGATDNRYPKMGIFFGFFCCVTEVTRCYCLNPTNWWTWHWHTIVAIQIQVEWRTQTNNYFSSFKPSNSKKNRII